MGNSVLAERLSGGTLMRQPVRAGYPLLYRGKAVARGCVCRVAGQAFGKSTSLDAPKPLAPLNNTRTVFTGWSVKNCVIGEVCCLYRSITN